MNTGQPPAEQPESPPGEAARPLWAPSQTPSQHPKGRQRGYIAGLVLGLILNGLVGCGFFLAFEDNPTLLYSAWNRILVWLVVNLVIWGIIALATKLPFRGFPGGLGLAALVILSFESLYLVDEYPLPTPEQKCREAQEVYASVQELQKITSNTPVVTAEEYFDNYMSTKKDRSLGYILYMPAIPEIGINDRLIRGVLDDLQGQEKVGLSATQIRTAALNLKNTFRLFVTEACGVQ